MSEPLKNRKHESFARFCASGKSQAEAYVLAGFSQKGAGPSSARLLRNATISARIAHLSTEIAQSFTLRVAIDRDWVLQSLKTIGDTGKSESARVRAIELCGKEIGMFVERSEVKNIRTPDEIPSAVFEEMREQAKREMEEPPPEANPQPQMVQ